MPASGSGPSLLRPAASLIAALLSLPAAAADGPGRLEVRVDARVELMSIVFRLAGHPEYNRAAESEYLRAVEERFGGRRDHPVVRLAAELRRRAGISYDAPQTLAVHLLPGPELELAVPLDPWPAGIDRRWNRADAEEFLERLRAFARETKYFEFFESQRPFHERIEEAYRKAAAAEDPVSWFESAFGARPGAGFTLAPAPLTGPSNFGPRAVLAGGRESLYQILGIEAFDASGAPRIGGGFLPLLVHEMAHSYCNPLIDAHRGELDGAGERLFRAAEEAMRRQAYSDGRIVLYESLVRACVVLYLLDRAGEETAARALAQEESRAFLWTGDLVRAIRESRARASPPVPLPRAMPEIIAAFEEAAARDWRRDPPPFRGPINAVFARSDILLVGPDRPPRDLDLYIDRVYGQVLEKRGAVRARVTEVPEEKARTGTLILYGSPATNPLLGRVARDAGWSIEKERLRLGERVFEGEGLVLIACWPSPFDSGRAALVYAAFDPAALPGINSLSHGPTDWVVARREPGGGFTAIARGDFPKDLANRWFPPTPE